jgi:hypothetical protein
MTPDIIIINTAHTTTTTTTFTTATTTTDHRGSCMAHHLIGLVWFVVKGV